MAQRPNISVVKCILTLTSQEFLLLFENNQFKSDYHKHLKKFLRTKLNFSGTANKKKRNPNSITFQVKCTAGNGNGNCNRIASISVKDHKIYGEVVDLDVKTSCGHMGKLFYRKIIF